MSRLNYLYIPTLFLAILLAYLPGLHAPFLFDDFANIVLNDALHPKSISEIPNILDSRYSTTRPVALTTFAINYLFSGLNASDFRLVNIAIHFANAFILFFVAKLLLQYKTPLSHRHILLIAFWGAALWAINPIQTQSVTYIVQRMTSLATLFYLASILVFILLRLGRISRVYGYAVITVLFLLGIATKEIVATLPLAILLIDILFFREDQKVRRSDIAFVLTIIVLGLVYLYLKNPLLLTNWNEPLPGREFSTVERLLTETRVMFHYLSLLFFPLVDRLHLDYEVTISRSFLEPATTLISILGLATLLALSCYLRKKYLFATFAICFFLLGNAIEGSFLNLELAFIHRLYLPSAFFYLGILAHIPEHRYKAASLLIIIFFTFFTFNTFQRNAEWGKGDVLWEQDIQRGASTDRARINRSANLISLGKYEESIKNLQTVLDDKGNKRANPNHTFINPHHLDIMRLLLGESYFLNEEYDHAITVLEPLYKETHAINVEYYLLMSKVAGRKNLNYEESLKNLRKKESLPFYSCLLHASYLQSQGDYIEQEVELKSCITQMQEGNIVQLNTLRMYLANAYIQQKRFDDAKKVYLEIIDADSENMIAWQQLYRMAVSSGNTDGAEKIKRFLTTKGVQLD